MRGPSSDTPRPTGSDQESASRIKRSRRGQSERSEENPRRFAIVCATLVGAVALTWFAGRAAMPPPPPEPEPDPVVEELELPQAMTVLQEMLWPQDLPEERPWRYIVIHHSATHKGTIDAFTRFHRRHHHADDIGYHFVINNGLAEGTRDGQIEPTVRWYDQRHGAHCRVNDHPEFNELGIGICLVGHFNQYTPTEAQMESLFLLLYLLRDRYGVPIERVVGHGELKTTDCPGKLFPMHDLLRQIRSEYIEEQIR